MRPGFLLLGLVIQLPVAAKDKTASEWKELSPKDAGYSVLMPGTSVAQTETIRLPSGPTEVSMFVVERKKAETAYLVLFCEFPKSVLKTGTDERRLDYARDRAVAARKGKLVFEKKIKLGIYLGRELHFEVEGKGMVRQRLFAVKDKLFQLLVAGPRGLALGKDANRFLESFKIVP